MQTNKMIAVAVNYTNRENMSPWLNVNKLIPRRRKNIFRKISQLYAENTVLKGINNMIYFLNLAVQLVLY